MEPGLRERKKLATRRMLWQVAVDLFCERGFDQVSVAEIAAAAEVSKMTVFNYFPTKEDLVLGPLEEHVGDLADVVRGRAPGESALAAVRRHYERMVAEGDPSVGMHDDPHIVRVRRLIDGTPALRVRAAASGLRATELLAEALAAETGDPVTAAVAAGQLAAARHALAAANLARVYAGLDRPAREAAATADAARAFALLTGGLAAYAVR